LANVYLLGSVFNTAITADTNIFGSTLTPIAPVSVLRIYACLGTAGVLTLRRTKGAATVSEKLNGGTELTADAAYVFDVMLDSGETANLRSSASGTALKISVTELVEGDD
jgi:hypothetical protein